MHRNIPTWVVGFSAYLIVAWWLHEFIEGRLRPRRNHFDQMLVGAMTGLWPLALLLLGAEYLLKIRFKESRDPLDQHFWSSLQEIAICAMVFLVLLAVYVWYKDAPNR